MKKVLLMMLILPGFVLYSVASQAAAPATETVLEVTEAVVAAKILNREPQNISDTFAAGTGKLYCFSTITGGKPGDAISHQWMMDGEVMASVPLKLKGSPWCNYSYKTMPVNKPAKWSVKIMQGKKILKVVNFKLITPVR